MCACELKIGYKCVSHCEARNYKSYTRCMTEYLAARVDAEILQTYVSQQVSYATDDILVQNGDMRRALNDSRMLLVDAIDASNDGMHHITKEYVERALGKITAAMK